MKHSLLKRSALLLVLSVCLVGGMFLTITPMKTAHAATTTITRAASCYLYAQTFGPGYTWYPGNSNSITTCSGNTLKLIYQNDGNFVLYCNGNAIWSTGTWIGWWINGVFANHTSFQTDGNLVVYTDVYNPNTYGYDTNAVWASNTNGRGAGALILQRDGNLVIYQGNGGGNPIWASGTNGRC